MISRRNSKSLRNQPGICRTVQTFVSAIQKHMICFRLLFVICLLWFNEKAPVLYFELVVSSLFSPLSLLKNFPISITRRCRAKRTCPGQSKPTERRVIARREIVRGVHTRSYMLFKYSENKEKNNGDRTKTKKIKKLRLLAKARKPGI